MNRSASHPSSDQSLTGRVVVVAGGSGFLGRHLVAGLRAAGARVVVPSRSPAAPSEDPGVLVVTVDGWDDPAELLSALADGPWQPDVVVASVGGWWLGERVVELSAERWRALVESHLTGHYLVARSLLPVLERSAADPAVAAEPVYLMLNGAASREPMTGSGPVCVAGAGQHMLLEVLRAEAAAASVAAAAAGRGSARTTRFHEVVVLAAVAGDDRNLDPAHTVAPRQVVDAVISTLVDPHAPFVVDVAPVVAKSTGAPSPAVVDER